MPSFVFPNELLEIDDAMGSGSAEFVDVGHMMNAASAARLIEKREEVLMTLQGYRLCLPLEEKNAQSQPMLGTRHRI